MFCAGVVFPIELDLLEFTDEQHTLTVLATDAAGQSSSQNYTFFGIPDLDLTCSYNDSTNTLDCNGNNQLLSPSCAFDRQQPVACSFPLEIRLTGLRLGVHTITVTASDEFAQTESVSLNFEFALGPITVSIPATASVIEGKQLSPVLFGISGQALTTFPFSLSPFTYSQFETLTGFPVDSFFGSVPREATLGKNTAKKLL